jgi:hypothetical protein
MPVDSHDRVTGFLTSYNFINCGSNEIILQQLAIIPIRESVRIAVEFKSEE